MMKADSITSCYIGPEISPEQFIPEHFFLYLVEGNMTAYDGNREYRIQSGDSGIARRNHLAKYNKQKVSGQFEKVVVIFDQDFLKSFNESHRFPAAKPFTDDALVQLDKNPMVDGFVRSLTLYLNENGNIQQDFLDVKRSELLLILLKLKPELAGIFFDFGQPEKLDLEAFMNKHYKFNVSIERFAYMTGRSLSAFKRDFAKTFNDTPSRWLVQKRLNEAHFLIQKKGRLPSDVYLELGFEDLSHFSFAFKKAFGRTPTQVRQEA